MSGGGPHHDSDNITSSNSIFISNGHKGQHHDDDGGGGGGGGVDITELLRDCAAHRLNPHDDPYLADDRTFDLHDAMSATQLFDAKLDCCEISGDKIAPWNAPDVAVFPRPIPKSLDDPMAPLPWTTLNLRAAATIAAQLLVRLHSLLSGNGVGDSCFTCLYAHYAVLQDMAARLLRIDDDGGGGKGDGLESTLSLVDSLEKLSLNNNKSNNGKNDDDDNHNDNKLAQWAVFGSVLGLVVLSDKIRSIVHNADIYEEEDFTVVTHSLRFFTLDSPLAHAKVLTLVERKLIAADAAHQKHHVRIPLLVVRCFASFYSACLTLDKISPDARVPALDHAKQAVEQTTATLLELGNILAADPLVDEDTEETTRRLLQKCFDPFMVRPLVGNLPVRTFSFGPPTTAAMELATIVSELSNHVCHLFERGISLGWIQRLLSFVRGTNILTRSLIVANLYCADKLLGIHPFERLISDHLHHLFSAQAEPEPWLCTRDARSFLGRLAKPIYDVLKLSLLNQNRLRAHLEVFLLPEWAQLQKDAQALDFQSQSLPGASAFPHFTHFTLITVLKLMDLYVSSALQDGLVSCNHTDLWFHLWYRDFLLSILNQHVTMIQQNKDMSVVERKTEPMVTSPKQQRGKKKSGKYKNGKRLTVPDMGPHPPPAVVVPDPEDLEDNFLLKMVALRRNMCRKTIHLLAALSRAGILQEKTYQFTSMEQIFERRFEIFACVQQPPRLSYQNFLDGTNYTKIELDEFPTYVAEGFQHCRAAIDQLLIERGRLDPSWSGVDENELKGLRKVCIGNAVYAQKLAQFVASGEASVASFDFSAHGEFCIIKLAAVSKKMT